MVEIKAGRELDRAVAEAIGNTGSPHPEGYMGPSLPVPFLPSTDLNAAFSAAEAAKLFDYYYLMHGENQWEILEQCDAPFAGEELFVTAPTVSLAICAAILRLKGDSA